MEELKRKVQSEKSTNFSVTQDGVLMSGNKICVPNDLELIKEILEEAHESAYVMHPGSTKMYHDLKNHYWWAGMKRQVIEYVARCLLCQQIKVEHKSSGGELQSLPIPEWAWEYIKTYFVSGLPRTPTQYDAIWVVVDRLTTSAHFISVKISYPPQVLADIFVRRIVSLHGVPITITSD